MKYHSIFVDQARYATSIVAKYFYNTTFSSNMIFTKDHLSTSDEQAQKLTKEFKIDYRAFMGSLIYLFSTRVDFSFAVHKLAKFSANPGKVHFEGLVHLFVYKRDNKPLGLKYYADINDAPVTDLFRQDNIETKNHLIAFFYSSWQDCAYTDRSTGSYNIFYQGGPIDHGTNVPGTVAQSSAESEYNAACTEGMALAPLIMLIHEVLIKDPNIVSQEAHLIVLDSKSAMCMDIIGKDTKHTRHIESRTHFVRNGEK